MNDKSRSKGSFSSNTSYSSNNNIPNSVPDTDFDDDDDEFDNVSVLSLPVPPVVQVTIVIRNHQYKIVLEFISSCSPTTPSPTLFFSTC